MASIGFVRLVVAELACALRPIEVGFLDGMPRRTGEGGIEFRHRRFVFGGERVVDLPPCSHELAKGLLLLVLLRLGENGAPAK